MKICKGVQKYFLKCGFQPFFFPPLSSLKFVYHFSRVVELCKYISVWEKHTVCNCCPKSKQAWSWRRGDMPQVSAAPVSARPTLFQSTITHNIPTATTTLGWPSSNNSSTPLRPLFRSSSNSREIEREAVDLVRRPVSVRPCCMHATLLLLPRPLGGMNEWRKEGGRNNRENEWSSSSSCGRV